MGENSYYVLLANGAENDTNVLLTEHLKVLPEH